MHHVDINEESQITAAKQKCANPENIDPHYSADFDQGSMSCLRPQQEKNIGSSGSQGLHRISLVFSM